MQSLIIEAKEVYGASGLDCGLGLLPPATDADIHQIEAALSLKVPAELRTLYTIHGGQEYISPGVTGLFGEHRLLTPAETIESHTCYAENYSIVFDPPPTFPPRSDEQGHWVPGLIPFASWDAYALCIHATTGEVWEFIPSEGLIRHRPSIEAVLKEVIAAVRAGGEPQLGDTRLPSVWIDEGG